ncbi:hypothetical protein Avbf_03026 [Armadillidium vulgare]|nr:hypothetical protein Avbf_03026 [Armadillidium vulgare]
MLLEMLFTFHRLFKTGNYAEVSNGYQRRVFNNARYLQTLHDNNIRGVLYNGDVDMACNFLGNQWDIEELEFEDLGPSYQWHVNGQIAGFVKRYELLDFVTVKGSGHMVPTDKPAEALHLIDSFVKNQDY